MRLAEEQAAASIKSLYTHQEVSLHAVLGLCSLVTCISRSLYMLLKR